MKKINLELEDVTAFILATEKGWTPTIEDTSAEMVDDEYPRITNPVSIEDFLAEFCQVFIGEFVLEETRRQALLKLEGAHDRIKSAVIHKRFDEDFINGDSRNFIKYISDQISLFS